MPRQTAALPQRFGLVSFIAPDHNASNNLWGSCMIRRIELINFMSHRRTLIEPAAGLTVLVGPNNCGKSAVVSALQILCDKGSSIRTGR